MLLLLLLGLAYDRRTLRPVLGAGGGGYSGTVIHPVAVRAVHDGRRHPGSRWWAPALGYVVSGSSRVWFAGDTGPAPLLGVAGERFRFPERRLAAGQRGRRLQHGHANGCQRQADGMPCHRCPSEAASSAGWAVSSSTVAAAGPTTGWATSTGTKPEKVRAFPAPVAW